MDWYGLDGLYGAWIRSYTQYFAAFVLFSSEKKFVLDVDAGCI
jgi:hypothetical protein